MTLIEARSILKPPLVFGDERQIAARQFIERVHEAKEILARCRNHAWNCKCLDAYSKDETKEAEASVRSSDKHPVAQ